MKKIAALGLAALMAVTATVATSNAEAKPYWPHAPFPVVHHHYNPGPSFYFRSPFFFGFQIGPQYPRYYRAPLGYYSSAHVQWCSWRYRTYNPATNTFFIKKGVPAVCVSPYWR